MRLLLVLAATAVAGLVLAAAAGAKVTKFTFSDVTYPDGTTGEIVASVKDTNKSDLTYCGYFSDDFLTSLGYYEEFSAEPPSTDPDDVLSFCLARFDERFQ